MACIVYITRNEREILDLSVKTHLKHDWVNNIVILHTDEQKPDFNYKDERIKEYHQYFGDGFEKSLEEGGFNEVDARNRALELAYKLDSDYYLITDSDEIWLYETKYILEAYKKDLNSLFISTYPVINNQTVAMDENCIFGELHDPHFRIINRKSLIYNPENTKIQYNSNKQFLKQFKNQSLHCYLKHTEKINRVAGVYHLHLKYHPKVAKNVSSKDITHYNKELTFTIKTNDLDLYN